MKCTWKGSRRFSVEGSQDAKKIILEASSMYIYVGSRAFSNFLLECCSAALPSVCVAGLQVLHHHKLHVTACRWRRSDVFKRDFLPALDSLFFRPLVPTYRSEEFVPSLTKANKGKQNNLVP